MSKTKSLGYIVFDSRPVQWVTRLLVAVLSHLLPSPHLKLTYLEITVPGLSADLSGLKVLHISDLHFGAGSELASELPELVANVPHDLALYTGDFIENGDSIKGLERILERMPRVTAAYAVLGNHDHTAFGDECDVDMVRPLCAVLHAMGIDVLTNSARPVFNETLFVVGVDDPSSERDNLDEAMRIVPPGACYLLLAHSPDVILNLGPYRPGLILSGHTHGGQVRLPLFGPVFNLSKLPRDQLMGIHNHDGVLFFVTRGIGYSSFNLRLWCPPEVVLITLRSA